jgi:hypothetical protein
MILPSASMLFIKKPKLSSNRFRDSTPNSYFFYKNKGPDNSARALQELLSPP